MPYTPLTGQNLYATYNVMWLLDVTTIRSIFCGSVCDVRAWEDDECLSREKALPITSIFSSVGTLLSSAVLSTWNVNFFFCSELSSVFFSRLIRLHLALPAVYAVYFSIASIRISRRIVTQIVFIVPSTLLCLFSNIPAAAAAAVSPLNIYVYINAKLF